MPKLSIVIPVYNAGKLLDRCLSSLTNQSFKNFEILIINDGSTDNSLEVINSKYNDSLCKVINLGKNCGVGNARNIGLHNSKGEYIAFVDSDDWVDLDLYIEMISALNESGADIAICGIKNEYENSILSEIRYEYKYKNQIDSETAINLLINHGGNNCRISPVVWNKVYKKEIIINNNISFLKNSYWEDDIFNFQVFLHTRKVCFIPSVVYHYYQRENSITRDFSIKHIEDLTDSFFYLKTYLINSNQWIQYKDQFNAFLDRALCSLFKMLFENEPSVSMQKYYIIELYKRFSQSFSVEKALGYLDVQRVKRIFI